METLNIHQAKTHLSRLLARVAAKREGFVIAWAGKPVAKVVPLDALEDGKARRLGCMAGQIKIPADFDRMGEAEIEALFGGRP